jgi:hypothetical protein
MTSSITTKRSIHTLDGAKGPTRRPRLFSAGYSDVHFVQNKKMAILNTTVDFRYAILILLS